jgi:ferredoxin
MGQGMHFLPRASLQRLLDALLDAGYACLGPQVRDGAIVYETLDSAQALPFGWHDRQAPASYHLERDTSPRAFAWATGPQALKPLCFAPREALWRVGRGDDGALRFEPVLPDVRRSAVIGVRACDLAALRLQDQHFLEGPYRDPYYAARREALFLVAVHCTHPADTCFCASTGDGPEARSGLDLALHELDGGYIVQAGSEQGGEILSRLTLSPVRDEHLAQAADQTQRAIAAQSRSLPSRDLKDALFAHLDHPRWDEVSGRCLACGNCTAVCPSCFCHSELEQPALSGTTSAHLREWDSCFTAGHSYMAGVVLRKHTRARYRQWLTHKLGSWHDQYGRSGCVGCGRCITWCPVGIDITEEAGVICQGEAP